MGGSKRDGRLVRTWLLIEKEPKTDDARMDGSWDNDGCVDGQGARGEAVCALPFTPRLMHSPFPSEPTV